VIFLSKEQEDGVGARIGVEVAGVDESVNQGGWQSPFCDQVTSHTPQMSGLARGQSELWLLIGKKIRSVGAKLENGERAIAALL